MPMYDETYLIAQYHEELSKYTKVPIPELNSIISVHEKDRLMVLANQLQIPIPKTIVISPESDPNRIMQELHFPIVLKPNKGGGAWGVLHIPSKEKLNQMYPRYVTNLGADKILAQEKVNGTLYCTAMLFNRGELKATCSYKQLREYPITGGTATLRISVHCPPIERALFRLLSSLKWHGVCQADFIVNETSGEFYLLDANPRFWGSLLQSICSGVDFPYLLYQIASKGDSETVLDYQLGIKTRWILGDFRVLIDRLWHSKKKLKAIYEFCSFWENNTYYDDFSIQDPIPFFIAPLFTLQGMLHQRTLNPTRGGF